MITIDNDANIPLYIQIYEQVKNQIITKKIIGGNKLPSVRTLANTLSISRNTVESAYMQLVSEGYVESKPGSGFIVLKLNNMDLLKPTSKVKLDNNQNRIEINYKYNFLSRGISACDFPTLIWKKLTNNCLSTIDMSKLINYNTYFGERELKAEIVKYLHGSRGVNCTIDQVIISSGMEYALGLLSQLFRNEINQVAIEDPGYVVASNVFKNNGYEVLPISLENDGINIDELENSKARMVYITPSHQFPMGYVMPIQKRLKLLDWAKRTRGFIIEDDYDSEFRYNSRPIPALQSIDSVGSVIYIGTFSKSLSPSLRINYLVLPVTLLEKFNLLFKTYRVSVSYIQQKVLEQFMHLGYWERHLRKIHHSAVKKHDLLIKTIHEYFGDSVIIHGENAGIHIVLEFKNGLKEEEIIERTKNSSILVSPISHFWIRKDKYTNNMIILGFGGMPEDEIIEGIKTLKESLNSEKYKRLEIF